MADDSSEDVVGAIAPVLKLSQSEISFAAPFSKAPEARIILLNPSDDAVAFKIRTTAPKRYCVRPNIGIILPKDKVEIQVVLSPAKDPITDFNQRDKFQVLSTIVKDALKVSSGTQDPTSVKDLFDKSANVPTMKQKLRSYFKPPPGSAPTTQQPAADTKKKSSSRSVGFEGSQSQESVDASTASAPTATATKSEPETASDKYTSALSDSTPASASPSLRQRNVENTQQSTPSAPVTTAKASPTPSAHSKPSSGSADSNMVSFAIIFVVGLLVGILLTRMIS